MSKTIMFMGNGSPDNGGCEAITKGTIQIIKETIGKDTIFIDCFFDYSGIYKNNDKADIYPVRYPKRLSIKWFILQIALRLSSRLTNALLFSKHKNHIKNADAVLSLGGDNYSLDYGIPIRFICLGKYIKKMNTPFVIWGASIGPFSSNPSFETKIKDHLKNDVDLILLREDESQKYLDSLGIKDNVRNVADPAFMMIPEPCIWWEQNAMERYICINFSDLMAKYVTDGDIPQWISICRTMIQKLLTEYEYHIVLIPHVKCDYEFMHIITEPIQSDRVIYAPKTLNAAQMKWIISKAECNIACRTHSTIASFSTSVPTISLGYSIKSKGLNKQMYGHEKYLLYCKEINADALITVFNEVLAHKDLIREDLERKNIEIRASALQAGIYLKKLLANK